MSVDISAAVAAASFWAFVAVCVVAGALSSIFRHRETQKTIRQAMEHGQSLDPDTLERLLQSNRPPKASRGGFLFGGIMLLAMGGGIAVMGWFASRTDPGVLNQGLGVGSLVGLLGVGLLVVGLVTRDPRGDGRG